MRQALLISLSCSLLLLACGGDTGSSSSKVAMDATGDTTGDAPVAPVDPHTLVPAEALTADPATVCADGYADGALDAGQHGMYLAAEQNRSFYLVLPDATTFTGPRPLLVAFNGTDGTGSGYFESAMLQAYVDRGFIVLAPDSNANGTVWPVWDAMRMADDEGLPNADLEYLDSLIPCVATHHAVDAHRIYLTGMSAGGMMANRVLRSRSELFAGGMVGSGIFDLTAPTPSPDLAPMAVIVSWGGDNDGWGGEADDPTVSVPDVNFVEQASIASHAYHAAEGVYMVACHGDNLGHEYLGTIAGWAAEFFLMHPKGASQNPHYAYEPPTQYDETVTCSEDPFVYVPDVVVECPTGESDVELACYEYCQFTADCVVENGTVSGPLGPQMSALGFSGDSFSECGGCVEACVSDQAVGAEADDAVLECFSVQKESTVCSSGVTGAMPFIMGVNTCCLDALDSAICARVCTTAMQSDVAAAFFEDSCAPWAPEGDPESEEP